MDSTFISLFIWLSNNWNILSLCHSIGPHHFPHLSVLASVGSLEMTGVTQGDGPTPFITSEMGREGGMSPLLDFQLEVNPRDVPDKDLLVKATLQPVELIYDAVSFNQSWLRLSALILISSRK